MRPKQRQVQKTSRSSFDASQSDSSNPRRPKITLPASNYDRSRSDVDESQTANHPAPPDDDRQYIIEDLERLASNKDYIEFFNTWSNNLETWKIPKWYEASANFCFLVLRKLIRKAPTALFSPACQ